MGGFLYLIAPELEPQASMALTTRMDSTSPSGTWPKTTCLPSSHEVTTVVMKNWEPLLNELSAQARERLENYKLTCWGRR